MAYYADGTELILQYLKENYGDQFRAYWEGDPYDIPITMMPCIIVAKQNGSSNPGPTNTNDITETIIVKVVMNKLDDFGAAKAAPNADLTERKLRRIIEGRDATTADYIANTVCGILATNITLGNNILQMRISTQYMLNQRTPELLTQEGHVSINLRERVQVLSRN